MDEFKRRKQQELTRYAEDHRRSMERNEEEYRREIQDLEKQIDNLMKENSRSQEKLKLQKTKEKTELEILKVKHKKEIDAKKAELKKSEAEHLEEIRKRMEELEIMQEQISRGQKDIARVKTEEDVIRNILTQLFEINRLWLMVMEEMEPLILIKDIDDRTKGAFEVLTTILSDMKQRKQEMNEHCQSKCVVGIQDNRDLVGKDKAQEVLGILEKISQPFACMEALIQSAKNHKVPDTTKLENEVNAIAKSVQELQHISLSPSITVAKYLEQGFKAIAN